MRMMMDEVWIKSNNQIRVLNFVDFLIGYSGNWNDFWWMENDFFSSEAIFERLIILSEKWFQIAHKIALLW